MEFNKDNNFERRMKLLCDTCLQHPEFYRSIYQQIPLDYQNYINSIGFEKIKALGYKEKWICDYISSQINLKNSSMSTLFTVGSKYSTQQIKEMLRDHYEINNIYKTPKATDLLDYFDLKACQFVDKKINKKVNGFLIVSKK